MEQNLFIECLLNGESKMVEEKTIKETLKEFIKWYNEKRIHHALNYDTPEKIYEEKL